MPSVRARVSSSFQRLRAWLRRLGWEEIRLPVMLLIVLSCMYLFIRLADEVQEGDTQRFDERILRALRRPDDSAVPVGPVWLRGAALDATALGGPLVLGLVIALVTSFMFLRRQRAAMWFTLAAAGSGVALAFALKYLIERDRPTSVPHLREVHSPSFPSGHALLSAVVYLTLGMLLMELERSRLAKLYWLSWAVFLTLLVGTSRVYLGVHYPTDVLAGWVAGLAWALGCWVVARYGRYRRGGPSTSIDQGVRGATG